MAGPIAGFVQLPLDTGNTGKKMRTQSRVVGADTVHEHFFVQASEKAQLGVYSAALALQSVQASAQNGTATGFLWAHVPVAITNKKSRIRSVGANFLTTSAVATPTAPRIVLALFTFTGTASGAAVTPGKLDSNFPASILDLRTAVTGLTVSVGAVLSAVLPMQLIQSTAVAVTAFPPTEMILWPLTGGQTPEDDMIVLAPGQGGLVYQPDAGTASDPRRFSLDLSWDDIDTA